MNQVAPVNEVLNEVDLTNDPDVSAGVEDTRKKILHVLETYPYISRGMLQQGLSPALPPRFWEPVLLQLIERNEVCKVETQVESPKGRNLSVTIFHLPKFPYPPVDISFLEAVNDRKPERGS